MKPYRRRKPAAEAHIDDWLMTYADMITLLLCFFAIFLSVSLPKKEIPPAKKVEAAQTVEPFNLPTVFTGNLPFHGVPVSDLPPDEGVTMVADSATKTDKFADSATQINKVSDAAPKKIPDIEPASGAEKPDTRDRITIVEMNSAAFFDSGSAVLSGGGKSILSDVASTLKGDQYRDYAATVEGHTDDAPISTPQFPSNWELSTARAASVVRFLIEEGVPAAKLRAAGYADTFPKAPNRDAFGAAIPENQAKNRRVAIKLEKIEKQ